MKTLKLALTAAPVLKLIDYDMDTGEITTTVNIKEEESDSTFMQIK